MIHALHARCLQIPFKQSFKHASAARHTTQSIWVEVELPNGLRGYGEGCPREYVTGETVSSALDFIRGIDSEVRRIGSLPELTAWVQAHRRAIDAHPAAWCAVELALLDGLARAAGQSVEALLAQPAIQGPFFYSAVLGAEAPGVFAAQLERYLSLGLRDFKVKLSGGSDDLERVARLKTAAAGIASLRFDANNLWQTPDQAIHHLERLEAPFFALEEPLAPGSYAASRRIAEALGIQVILDESLLRADQLDHLRDDPARWIVNLRLSKMGGLLRSLELATQAQALGLPIILGCQVGETSLLTRAALCVAQAQTGKALLAQEGAFGTLLLSQDVVERPLMFGPGGQLDVSAHAFGKAAGFGLDPVPPFPIHDKL